MSASVDQVFAESLAHHHAGRLAEAEKGYCLVLETTPSNADSLHLLGVIDRADAVVCRAAYEYRELGYVSSDFREHAVARFVLPLLKRHDRRQFEIHAYADVAQPDAMTSRIQAECDH